MGSFKDVVGHKDIINYIRNAVTENKVSHAYILNGERGSGKKMLANLFATTLLCEKQGPDPCNACHSCHQAESGNHPDIIRVTHEKPGSIAVDDIREQVNQTVAVKPYQGAYKVYIIPEADLMTVQAQNALLKTIEEPPEYVVILLLTENADQLLPTINSRCVMLKLRNIKDKLIKRYLMEMVSCRILSLSFSYRAASVDCRLSMEARADSNPSIQSCSIPSGQYSAASSLLVLMEPTLEGSCSARCANHARWESNTFLISGAAPLKYCAKNSLMSEGTSS